MDAENVKENKIDEAKVNADKRGPELSQYYFTADEIRPPEIVFESATDESLGLDNIPQERYFSQEFHYKEVEKVWKKVWQMACWTQDIPNPGDIHVYDIADISVLVVRQNDGSLKAFHNACLHRGRQLCEKSTHAPALRCPYHSFAWNLNGTSRHIPARWDFPQIDKASFNLPEVRVEEWNGFAFVNLDSNAPPLMEYLERFPEHWKAWDLTTRYKSAHVVKKLNANWKAVVDAFIEGFHASYIHPQITAFTATEQTQYDVWPDQKHYSRAITMMGTPSSAVNTNFTEQQMVDYYIKGYLPQATVGSPKTIVPPGGSARDVISKLYAQTLGEMYKVDLSKLDNASLVDGIWYYVFPNFEPWPGLGFPLFYRFRPDGNDPDKSLMDVIILSPFEGERPPSAEIIYQGADEKLEDVLGPLGAILDQDTEQMGAIQRGMRASVRPGLLLSKYQEARIRHYHRTLMEYIES